MDQLPYSDNDITGFQILTTVDQLPYSYNGG